MFKRNKIIFFYNQMFTMFTIIDKCCKIKYSYYIKIMKYCKIYIFFNKIFLLYTIMQLLLNVVWCLRILLYFVASRLSYVFDMSWRLESCKIYYISVKICFRIYLYGYICFLYIYNNLKNPRSVWIMFSY